MKKINLALLGVLVGVVNILFGAGGGILAVPILKKYGCDQKGAQANAVAVILPLTIFSFIIYAKQAYVNFFPRIWIVPFAAVGAVLGTLVFKKMSSEVLRKIFAVFMIWAGVRMLWNL